jgi:hypothetical protein
VDFRDRGFQRDDAVGFCSRIGNAGERLELDHIAAIGGAIAVIFGPGQHIIIAVGHAEAALPGVDRIARRVLQVGAHAQTDRRRKPRLGEQRDQLGPRLRGGDARQVRLQRRDPTRFDPARVHPAGVKVADLLPDPSRLRRVLRHILDDRPHIPVGLVVEHRIDPDIGLVWGDIRLFIPGAVDEIEEIVPRLDRAVHRRGVIAPAAIDGLALGKRRTGKHDGRGGRQQYGTKGHWYMVPINGYRRNT